MADPDPAVRLLATHGASATSLRRLLGRRGNGRRLDRSLRRSLGSAEPGLRSAALDALQAQRRRGFSALVRSALLRGEPTLRARAAEVAAQLPDPSPSLLVALRGAASEDPDPRVRERVVEALASRRGVASRMAVVRACADPDPGAREIAFSTLARIAPELSLVHVLEALDLGLLVLMARKLARVRGLAPGWGGSVETHVGALCGAPHLSASPAHGASPRAPMPDAALLEAAVNLVLREENEAWERSVFAKRMPTLGERVVSGPPHVLLAVAAGQCRLRSPAVADRLGLLAVFASPELPAARVVSHGSLAERLRALSPPSPLEACFARTRALAGRPLLIGLAAAYALARVDPASRSAFERRCLGHASDRHPFLGACHCARLGAEEAMAFAEALARCPAIRPHRRLFALVGISEIRGFGPDVPRTEVRRALLEEVALDPGAPPAHRAGARQLLER
jgi:hypothetical protein